MVNTLEVNEKNSNLNSKKNKGPVCKEKLGAPVTPPHCGDNMNHVTGQDRRNDLNPQNNVNEVEEMDTQDGTYITKYFQCENQETTLIAMDSMCR